MGTTSRHLVVDGSNIATEGRTRPSLSQLDEAVRAVLEETPSRQVTVIVDATFAHRIDANERASFDEAVDNGEVITPPAGTVGRGDAFILQVAERADATVLSNDSFQEFHGEHAWLFDDDRLIGGKPVDGVGWIFMPRVPVRGPASRRSVRSARPEKKPRAEKKSGTSRRSRSASGPPPVPSAKNPPPNPEKRSSAKRTPAKKSRTSAPTTKKKADAEKGASSTAKSTTNVKELNSPHDFMVFVTQHSIGDEINGIVERFSSHGCYVRASSAQCYLPSSRMGDPPPTRARDVAAIGQEVTAKVESIDTDRRGINVALVRVLPLGDQRANNQKRNRKSNSVRGSSRGTDQSITSQSPTTVADETVREANRTRSDTNVATKKAAKKRPAKKATKKAAAKKATVKKAAKATTSARATKAVARKAGAKKTAKKTVAKAATKKTTKTAAKKTATKATAKKATAKKTAKKAPAKKTATKTTAKRSAKKAASR